MSSILKLNRTDKTTFLSRKHIETLVRTGKSAQNAHNFRCDCSNSQKLFGLSMILASSAADFIHFAWLERTEKIGSENTSQVQRSQLWNSSDRYGIVTLKLWPMIATHSPLGLSILVTGKSSYFLNPTITKPPRIFLSHVSPRFREYSRLSERIQYSMNSVVWAER